MAWRDYNVQFFYLYTREPHPGFYQKPQTGTIEERKANARQCEKDLGMTLPWIIDDMKSSIQKAYGGLPNCAYIINIEGEIFYKEAWADSSNLNKKLKELYETKPSFKAAAAEYVKMNILPEKDSDRRIELARKLARLACDKAYEALIEIFSKEKDKEVRARLVRLLFYTRQKESLGFLINLLVDEEDVIRSAAIETLEKLTGENFGYKPTDEKEKKVVAVEKWMKWWKDSQDRLKWSESLGRFEVNNE